MIFRKNKANLNIAPVLPKDFNWYLTRAAEGPARRQEWQSVYGTLGMDRIQPHCDPHILHGPEAECRFCDLYPEAQMLRVQWGINFTGEHDPGKRPCPAETRRDIESINQWAHNRPAKPGSIYWMAEDASVEDFLKAAGLTPSLSADQIELAKTELEQARNELAGLDDPE